MVSLIVIQYVIFTQCKTFFYVVHSMCLSISTQTATWHYSWSKMTLQCVNALLNVLSSHILLVLPQLPVGQGLASMKNFLRVKPVFIWALVFSVSCVV